MRIEDAVRSNASGPVRIVTAMAILSLLWGCTPSSAINPPNAPLGAAGRVDSQPELSAERMSTSAPRTSDVTGLRPSYSECIAASHAETPAMRDCIDTEYRFQDQRLNIAYRSRMERSGKANQAVLREAQQEWISARDKRCFDDGENGQAGALDAYVCRLEMTAARAGELESQ